jgi:hypothetical protein
MGIVIIEGEKRNETIDEVDWNKSYGLGTADLRNLWYGFVRKGNE